MSPDKDHGPNPSRFEPNNSRFEVWYVWLLQKTVAILNEGPEKDKQPLMNRCLDSFILIPAPLMRDKYSKYVKNKKLALAGWLS